MKLLLCIECSDLRSLSVEGEAKCRCGKSRGRYLSSDGTAVFSGDDALLIGFDNESFIRAIRRHINDGDRPDGLGWNFEAFLIPESAPKAWRKKKI